MVGRSVREVLLYPTAFGPKKPRRVAFVPSSGPEQSGLQRAYMVAEQMEILGWQCMVIPKHLSARQRRRLLRAFEPKAVLVQKCRHPLNRIEYLADWPLILDVDDADFLDPALTEPMAAVARHANGVICGSRFIQDWAAQYNPNTTIIWTGSPNIGTTLPSHAMRERIVTWAQSNPLAAAAEFDFIEDIILRAHARTAPFTLRLYGWRWPEDHPRLKTLRDAGVTLDLVAPLPYEAFLQSLQDVAVGLSAIEDGAFSHGKSFGKILGYLDAKVPIICSDRADHELFFTPDSGVVSNDPSVWVDELVDLLDKPARRTAMAEHAYASYCRHLDIRAVARKVANFVEHS